MNPAKQYLSRYRNLQIKCRTLESTIESLRERAESITINLDPNKVQSSAKIHDPIAEAAASIADTERLLAEARAESELAMNKITRAIMSVNDDRLQTLLVLRYIKGLSWESIAEEMCYSIRQIYNLHGIALNLIGKDFIELQ